MFRVLFFLLIAFLNCEILWSIPTKVSTIDFLGSERTTLSRHLWRVLTQNREESPKVFPFQSRSIIMNSRWTSTLPVIPRGDQLTECTRPSEALSWPSSPSTAHAQFHRLLAERVENAISNEVLKNPSRKIPRPNYEHTEESLNNPKYNDRIVKSFIEGHYFTIITRTAFPKVFVTLYPENKNQVYVPWFVPVEQALLYQRLGEYRDAIAVLKNWEAYSKFGIAVIPEGYTLSVRVGLASPQSYLQTATSIHPETLHQELKTQEDYVRECFSGPFDSSMTQSFYELLKGGGTQFYINYAYKDDSSAIKVYPLNALYCQNDEFKSKYHRKPWKIVGTCRENHHMIDSRYDDVRISFPDAFRDILKSKSPSADNTKKIGEEGELEEFTEVIEKFQKLMYVPY